MKEQLYAFLAPYNNEVNGLLISIPLTEYIDKIIKLSTLQVYYEKGVIRGIISYYKNDRAGENGFLTLILIDKSIQSRGVGSILLDSSINDLKSNNYKYYSLEVLKTNIKAIKFYESRGFVKESSTVEKWMMRKVL